VTDRSVGAAAADTSAAQRFVADRYGARAGGVTLLGAGEWSRAYAFALDGRPVVIRFGAYGEDFAKDRTMAGVASAALPIPEFIDMGPAPGGYFAVSVRANGVALDDLDGPAMRAVLPALLAALDAIRDLTPPTTAGYGLWPAGGSGPADSWAAALLSIDEDRGRTPGWRDRLATSRAGTRAFQTGYAKLAELANRLPTERHVVHGDLLNRNVLVDGGRISAVLDWGNALYGDHLYDAAWLLYWWPWMPKWAGIDIRADLDAHWRTTGDPPRDADQRLCAYQLHIGLDALAYTAFVGRRDHVERNGQQVMSLVAASSI
jgi:hygromycin-B 4-O-kinase